MFRVLYYNRASPKVNQKGNRAENRVTRVANRNTAHRDGWITSETVCFLGGCFGYRLTGIVQNIAQAVGDVVFDALASQRWR